jgi:hypothetical protein
MQNEHNRPEDAAAAEEFTTPFGAVTSLAKQARCDHDWQPDGQTLTAVRWTCTKCFKTELR